MLIFGCRAQTYGTHIPCPGADGCGRLWFFDKPDQASAHTICTRPGLNLPAGSIHRSRGAESEGRHGFNSVIHRQPRIVEQITHAGRRYLSTRFPRASSPKSTRRLESGLLLLSPHSPQDKTASSGRWGGGHSPVHFHSLWSAREKDRGISLARHVHFLNGRRQRHFLRHIKDSQGTGNTPYEQSRHPLKQLSLTSGLGREVGPRGLWWVKHFTPSDLTHALGPSSIQRAVTLAHRCLHIVGRPPAGWLLSSSEQRSH